MAQVNLERLHQSANFPPFLSYVLLQHGFIMDYFAWNGQYLSSGDSIWIQLGQSDISLLNRTCLIALGHDIAHLAQVDAKHIHLSVNFAPFFHVS